MRTPCKPWRMSEIRAIDAALATGASAAQVGRDLAEALGRSPWSVAWKARLRRGSQRSTSRPALHGGRRWTLAEVAHINAAARTGETAHQAAMRLAPQLERTYQSVYQRMELAISLLRPPRPYRFWTGEDIDRLRQLRAEGLTWEGVAARMGLPLSRVSAAAQRLGIAKRRGGR